MCCAVLSHSVVSDPLWPHGLKPTRLLCPWNPPGNNAGIGCQALLQGIFPTEGSNPGLSHCMWILYHLVTRLLYPQNFTGRNTEVGSHSLFQGIFPTERSNPGLLHCRQIPYHLRHEGNPWSLQLPLETYVIKYCLCEYSVSFLKRRFPFPLDFIKSIIRAS